MNYLTYIAQAIKALKMTHISNFFQVQIHYTCMHVDNRPDIVWVDEEFITCEAFALLCVMSYYNTFPSL